MTNDLSRKSFQFIEESLRIIEITFSVKACIFEFEFLSQRADDLLLIKENLDLTTRYFTKNQAAVRCLWKYFLPVQLTPDPSYPLLHVQLYKPIVLLQYALSSQLWSSLKHSSISDKNNGAK